MKKHNFRELTIWKDSMSFVKKVYLISANLPTEERFGFVSQINRSSVSIPTNIAEGSGRTTNKEFVRFLDIAISSSYELETQLILAEKFNYISNKTLLNEVFLEIEVESKMLNSFIKKVDNIN